jgi:hypothetical protein
MTQNSKLCFIKEMYGQFFNVAFLLSLLEYKPEEVFSPCFTAERELYESIPWGETMAKDEAALLQALYRTASTAKQPQVRHCGLVFGCEMAVFLVCRLPLLYKAKEGFSN